MKRCILIGPMDIEFDIKSIIKDDDFIFCADGGYLQAKKHNIKPDMIIGDFDSSSKPDDLEATIISLPKEKDDTDTHYIAKEIVKRGFTDVILCGVSGGRFDHYFSNLQTLKYFAENNINAVIISNDSAIMIVRDNSVCISPKKDGYLSVFSFDTEVQGVTIKNTKYEVNNIDLKNNFPIGVSNEFTDKPATISVKRGSLLVVITKKD